MSALDLNHAIPWIMLATLVAILVVRWVYLIKVDGKALDLRLTPIRILIIVGVLLAIAVGVWTIPRVA